jgi:lipoprotein-anchoring transpeptidase ErfK/SrfK
VNALTLIPHTQRPAFVPSSARYIAVQLSSQTLVAYEGERPVYATLVSTGKAGFETPTGIYRIQHKHISATMDGEVGAESYRIEDVPWTMYFSGSLALHAAFWHQGFGRVRSHGCVNLAPLDAHWLFDWATPTLPPGFHGVNTTRENPGTFVVITP